MGCLIIIVHHCGFFVKIGCRNKDTTSLLSAFQVLVFFANDGNTRIYPTWKAKSKERIEKYVNLIESGKINDYDIPDEIYEEVYSEMRQK